MGGKLIQSVWNLPEKRLLNQEYHEFKSRILSELKELFPSNVLLGVADAIRSKESHGDLDVICGVHGYFDSSSLLMKKYNTNVHKNSNVTSFPVDGFQVDVTFVPAGDFQSTIDYTSWGDAGNLVGRVAHKMGVKFGHDGLMFWIRRSFFDRDLTFLDNDTVMEKIVLTKDFSVILPLLGFDYERWKKGFNTNEEVFDWVASSKYFNAEIFSFENLNHINRVRNKKRAMYAAFVTWLENNSWKYDNFVFQHRSYYLPDWVKVFPDLRNRINHNKKEYVLSNKFKEKLNGHLVMELLNTTDGKTVGKILSQLKSLHSREEYINMSQLEINDLVLKFKICSE